MTIEQIFNISKSHPIVFYDGVCHLCNGFIQMVIRHDKTGKIKFAALQDSGGLAMREHLNQQFNIDTTIGLYKEKVYTHSDVLWMVAITLGGAWHLLRPLYIIPKSVRDRIYNWVARNRYNWFGQSESCIAPDSRVLERFISFS